MVSLKVTEVYRRDARAQGRELSVEERERLVKPYLPRPRSRSSPRTNDTPRKGVKTRRQTRRRSVRAFITLKIHKLLYYFIHLVFGIYIRLRQIFHSLIDRVLAVLYYHHRTPELIQKDTNHLSRLPEHLSVILTLKGDEDGGLETLMDEVAELGAWCASAGIPLLSVYEKSGLLKSYIPSLYSFSKRKLCSYFGHPPATPRLCIYAPNHPVHPPSLSSSPSIPAGTTNGSTNGTLPHSRPSLNILLLSATDGRDTLVDLTRTLTEMSQAHKIHPRDITSELINAEICATTSVPTDDYPSSPKDSRLEYGEPDLLIIFGPYVKLDGYPPWQIRLTEIFCVGDSGGDVSGRIGARVEYQAFLRGLWKYAGAQMRFGR